MTGPIPTPQAADGPLPGPGTESNEAEVSRFLGFAATASWSLGRHVFLHEKEEYLGELDRWCAQYGPTTELEASAIDRGIHTSLKKLRLEREETARIDLLRRCAEREWDLEQKNTIRGFAWMLWSDPPTAVRGLEESGAGCRWMIDGWLELERTWNEEGTWYGPNCVKAIALLGYKASPEALRASEPAYLTRLYSLLARPASTAGEVTALLDPEVMPVSLLGAHFLNPLPSPAQCHDQIAALMDRELVRLGRREESLRVGIEEPTRAAAVQRALEQDARLESIAILKRYYDQMLGSIHKSLNTLARIMSRAAEKMAFTAEENRASRPENSSFRGEHSLPVGPDGNSLPCEFRPTGS